LRTPKPCLRIIQTTTKGKWCGVSLLKVLQQEFFNNSTNILRQLLTNGLIRVNGIAIARTFDEANDYKLKNMDIIDRIIHWHEPPIFLPSLQIDSTKRITPKNKNDNFLYVCNKPCTVPVHPTGPYLSNTLTMLVEGQNDLNLKPMTLIPCHRIDRVTSGMVICSTNKQIVSLISQAMSSNTATSTITTANTANTSTSNGCNNHNGRSSSYVRKQYLAKVIGKFPSHNELNGPIETIDPANGIRSITSNGKPSISLFRLLNYDSISNTSIIICEPKTGRSHQLRVHLQWLGHSICGDILYGG
ncbi:pseudouridine synthase, partial [Fragilariopsis cylindrus CCMP1102]